MLTMGSGADGDRVYERGVTRARGGGKMKETKRGRRSLIGGGESRKEQRVGKSDARAF